MPPNKVVKKTGPQPKEPTPVAAKPKEYARDLDNEKPRVIFRFYEQLIHVEQARRHLQQVGIFMGPDAEEMAAAKHEVVRLIEKLDIFCNKQWRLMQNEEVS